MWFVVVLLVAGAGLVAAAVFIGLVGREKASQWAEIGGWYVAIIVGLAPLLVWLWRREASPAIGTTELIESVVAMLARWQVERWSVEQVSRQVGDPWALPVRWEVTDRARSVMASWSAIRGIPGAGPLPLAGSYYEIADKFTMPGSPRRLVVLGEPGAGKSMLVLQLALDLLRQRLPKDPVPILLSIAEWSPETQLDDWIAERLADEYHFLSRKVVRDGGEQRSLAREIIGAGRILPILDGFDEMAAKHRARALPVIAESLVVGRQFVLTSRIDEYERVAATGPLARTPVVEILPLRMEEVTAYLEEGDEHTSRWRTVTAHLLNSPDSALAVTLSAPLTAWLARVIYRQSDNSPDQMLAADWSRTPRSIEEHLLSRLIPAVYSQNIGVYRRRSAEETDRAVWYLGNLAHSNHVHKSYNLDWRQLRDSFRTSAFGVVFGLAGILIIGLVVGLLAIFGSGIWIGPAIALTSGLVFGLVFGLQEELKFLPYELRLEPEDKRPVIGPNELLRRDRKHTLSLILIFGFLIGLTITLVHAQVKNGLLLVPAILLMILVYLLVGNEWVLYMITRLLLAMVGVTPLRLMAFLKEAHVRGVLRQEGFVYQFRHALLQDLLQGTYLVPRKRVRGRV